MVAKITEDHKISVDNITYIRKNQRKEVKVTLEVNKSEVNAR